VGPVLVLNGEYQPVCAACDFGRARLRIAGHRASDSSDPASSGGEKNRVGYGIGSIILYTVAAGRFVAGLMSHEVVFCHLSKKIPD
jgi:hypothetical protein